MVRVSENLITRYAEEGYGSNLEEADKEAAKQELPKNETKEFLIGVISGLQLAGTMGNRPTFIQAVMYRAARMYVQRLRVATDGNVGPVEDGKVTPVSDNISIYASRLQLTEKAREVALKHSSMDAETGEPVSAMAAMFSSLPGVEAVVVSPYGVAIHKSPAFSWGEVDGPVREALRCQTFKWDALDAEVQQILSKETSNEENSGAKD